MGSYIEDDELFLKFDIRLMLISELAFLTRPVTKVVIFFKFQIQLRQIRIQKFIIVNIYFDIF